MIKVQRLLLSLSIAALSIPVICAQDLSTYRTFRLGAPLPALAKQAGVAVSGAKVICQRPALVQELEWQPARPSDSSARVDPVRDALFSFYNGGLYRIVVTYDQDRTEGLSDQDMIEGISARYGTPTTPVANIISSSPSLSYSDSEKVIARWENSEYSLSLFRFSHQASFGLLILSKQTDALAQVAIVEAARLREQEAPQREIDRQRKEDDVKRAAAEKARPANKAKFRP